MHYLLGNLSFISLILEYYKKRLKNTKYMVQYDFIKNNCISGMIVVIITEALMNNNMNSRAQR